MANIIWFLIILFMLILIGYIIGKRRISSTVWWFLEALRGIFGYFGGK